MKCIILAAGYATRLYPLTKNFPKPLLEVGGKPILDWLIDDIESAVDEIIIVSNHRFIDHFRTWAAHFDDSNGYEQTKSGAKISIYDDGTVDNEHRLGAVKDILAVAGEYKINEDTLVMAGDNMLDFSLLRFIEYANRTGTSCVMCHEENRLEALQKTAVITTDDEGKITSYEEKPREPRGNLAVPPFYYYKAEHLKCIEEALAGGCGYDAPGSFAAWLSRQVEMHAWKMSGKRYDIGDIASYEAVRERFR